MASRFAWPVHGFNMKSLTLVSLAFIVGLSVSFLEARAQTVTFDFDTAPLHTSLPLDLTAGGITAHFSSGSPFYNYSIQRADVLGFTPAGFFGNCIYPNTVFQSDLLISFGSTLLTDISIMYAPEEYDTDSSCTMRLTAYLGSLPVGTATFSIDPPRDVADRNINVQLGTTVRQCRDPLRRASDYGRRLRPDFHG